MHVFELICGIVGASDADSARAEHEAGEYVLADLEFGTTEETGLYWIFISMMFNQ